MNREPRTANREPRRLPLLVLCLLPFALSLVAAPGVPSKIGDAEFWRIVTGFSEPGGYFPSNNFVSNEMEYQTVIPELLTTVEPGGVYLGVGPDQNFTYISALRPKMAFIVDIRRQNMLQHLMYKALMEMAPTRADFLSRLFGRLRPPSLDDRATPRALLDAFAEAPPSLALFEETNRRMLDLLERQHGFTLSPDDADAIRYVLGTFYEYGPEITYAPIDMSRPPGFGPSVRVSMFPSFRELVNQSDGTGTNRGYLATEESYRFLRDLQRRNLIVPIVGDFAGDKALAAVGGWVRGRGAVVTSIYVSNVEQYLFQNNVWRLYYDNVAALPTDGTSAFVRAFFPFGGIIRTNPALLTRSPDSSDPINLYLYPVSSTLVSPVSVILSAVADGRIASYLDVIELSQQKVER